LKTGNSAFFQKAEKDVWHALLSFQGTGSRFGRGRAVPPAQLSENPRPKTEISDYELLVPGSTKTFSSRRSPQRRRARFPGLGKNWKPFRVDAQYRCSEGICQGVRESL
jgi:hypothetical protein